MTSIGSKHGGDLLSSAQSPQFYNSQFHQPSLGKSNIQQYGAGEKKDQNELDEWTPEEKEKLKQIIKMMKRMKDERRAHDLVKNLPTRMLKSFDQNKFNLLNDKSFHYDEQTYQDSINQYIMDNRKGNLSFKTPEFRDSSKQNTLTCSGFIDKYKNFQMKDTVVDKLQSKPSSLTRLRTKIDLMLIRSNCKIMQNIMKRVLDQIPIIQPSSPSKLGWDLIFMLVVITCLFYLPITIAFGFSFKQLLSVDLLMLIPTLLMLDIMIKVNTGYFEKGQVIKSRYKIMGKYLKKSMIKDAISVFPFIISLYYEARQSLLEDQTNKPTYLWSSNSNSSTYFLLLPFFFKGISLGSTLKKIEERFNLPRILTNIIQLAKLLFTIILINHLFACLWVFAARLEVQSGQIKTWMHSEGLQNSNWTRQYLAAFYFTTVTMITVGYGDILPQNEIEQILCVITMMLACGVFGYSLNEVGSIFSNFFQVDNEIKKKLILIQRFMSKKNINSKLQFQVREYLEYYWREQAETDYEQEQDIIDQLSDSLRQKLLFEANKIVLKDTPIFKHNFSKNVIEQTVPLIQEMKYSPESLICQQGSVDDSSIYFIENGSVDIVMNPKFKKQECLFRLQKGDCFGAYTFFTGLPRLSNVRSNEFTTVLKIRRQDFLHLISNYTEDYETFCSIRDSISYLGDFSRIGLKCKSCSSNYHLVNDCQYLHYVPNKARVIKSYNDFNNICHLERAPYKRRVTNPHYHYKNSRMINAEVLKQNQMQYNIKHIDQHQFINLHYNYFLKKSSNLLQFIMIFLFFL